MILKRSFILMCEAMKEFRRFLGSVSYLILSDDSVSWRKVGVLCHNLSFGSKGRIAAEGFSFSEEMAPKLD